MADTFVHVMEQYMTVAGQSRVMDHWAEGILQTLVEIAPKIRENQHDYQLMADSCFCNNGIEWLHCNGSVSGLGDSHDRS